MNEEVLFRQRMYRQARMYSGELDGVAGKLTQDAMVKWVTLHNNISRFTPAPQRTLGMMRNLLPATALVISRFYSEVNLREVLPEMYIDVISGLRTYQEQDELWRQGRTHPGDKVTNARAGESNHNFGLAFDIGIFRSDGGNYVRLDKYYEDLGNHLGESGFLATSNLSWGGLWPGKKRDLPHYEIHHKLSPKELRRRFETGEIILTEET